MKGEPVISTVKKNPQPRRFRKRLPLWQRIIIIIEILVILAACAVFALTAHRRSVVRRADSAEAVVDESVSPTLPPEPEPTATATPEPTRDPELPDVDITAWNLTLVRSDRLISSDYAPDVTLIEDDEYFDTRAADALATMIADARNEGYTVYLCSGYRSYDTQRTIYNNHIAKYMDQGMTEEEAAAATLIAVNYPGGSEHQLGLAADILESSDQAMEPEIGGSGLMLWLELHCADYGFVVRYPNGKTDITGVEYEPWHMRYVGTDAAQYMTEHDLCLEEFLALYGGYDLSSAASGTSDEPSGEATDEGSPEPSAVPAT